MFKETKDGITKHEQVMSLLQTTSGIWKDWMNFQKLKI